VTDAAGSVVERRFYDDFGRLLDAQKEPATESVTGLEYGFQGRRLDAETGLVYFRNRYYDPGTGRFVQRDPVWDAGNVGGWYTFVGNRPISDNDPHGLRRGRRGGLRGQRRANRQLRELRERRRALRQWYRSLDHRTPEQRQRERHLEEFKSRLRDYQRRWGEIPEWLWNKCDFRDYFREHGLPPPIERAERWERERRQRDRERPPRPGEPGGLAGPPLPPERQLAMGGRSLPGTTHGGRHLPEVRGRWLRGDGSVGAVPRQVANQLRGRSFENFGQFRQAFWKAVASRPELASQFCTANQSRMKKGFAPISPPSQWRGSKRSYELHHRQPIQRGGGVYNLDNLAVTSPRYHGEVLPPETHYGPGGGSSQ